MRKKKFSCEPIDREKEERVKEASVTLLQKLKLCVA